MQREKSLAATIVIVRCSRHGRCKQDCSQPLYLSTHAKEKVSETSASHLGVGAGGERSEPNEEFISVPTPYSIKSPFLRWHPVLSILSRPFNDRIKIREKRGYKQAM